MKETIEPIRHAGDEGMLKVKKHIGKKFYEFHGRFHTWAEASKEATRLRSQGYTVKIERLDPWKANYNIWKHKAG